MSFFKELKRRNVIKVAAAYIIVGWVSTALVRALVANSLHEEARKEIDDRIEDDMLALAFKALVMAHKGDQSRFDQLFEAFKVENTDDHYWTTIVAAWGGHREEANRLVAQAG